MTPGPLHRATGALAWVSIVAIVAGLVVSLVPLDNPGVQSCGAPVTFLLSGELDRIPDAQGRIQRGDRVVTLDPAARRRAFDSPCSERIGRRAIPAGILVVSGSVLGLLMLTIGITSAWRRASAAIRTEHDVNGGEP